MTNSKQILVILPNNLGDVIMATPVVEGLKKKYPSSFITFFVESEFNEGLIANPNIDRIFTFNRKVLKHSFLSDAVKSGTHRFITAINHLVKSDFNVVINLSQTLYIANLLPLLKVPEVIGCSYVREGNYALKGRWTDYLYAIPFARQFNSFHVIDVYRRMAQVNEFQCGCSIHLTEKEIKDAGLFLQAHGIDITNSPIALFQPGAARPAKCWPWEHFIKLGQLLIAQNWQIIISGAKPEKELAEKIGQHLGKNCFVMCGETDFRQAIATLLYAKICVTGDTAIMHAAAGLQIETYALFGPTNPVETGPYGNNHHVFSGKCSQKPCFKEHCDTLECLKSISPEVIMSCIIKKDGSQDGECEIFKTTIKPTGDYQLIPQTNQAISYYNPAGAAMVQNMFEPSTEKNLLANDWSSLQNTVQEFIDQVSDMENYLCLYLKRKDSADIRNFEDKKINLQNLTGIAQFLTALLNLRLNSIPILNPIQAVHQSRQVCTDIINQVQSTLAINRVQCSSGGCDRA